MRNLFTTLALILAAACQTPMHTGSQCLLEPGALDHLNSYRWRHTPAIDIKDDTGFLSPIMIAQLEQATINELAGKGLQLTEAALPEALSATQIEVALTLRTRRELVSYSSSPNTCRTSDCWQSVDPGSNVRLDLRTIGFLAADVYVDGKPIWRGWVETQLYPKDRDAASEVITRAIPTLFESFPP